MRRFDGYALYARAIPIALHNLTELLESLGGGGVTLAADLF